ncbi:MAG: hypothetical protein QM756_01340 [Polyangiaceae bacterium]
MRAAVTERLHLNAALGVAHQPPAFVVPLPGFQPGGLRGGLQRALQESFGIEADLGNATTATATVFQNAYFDMSNPLGATEPRASGCAPGAFPTATLAGNRLTEATNPPLCRDRFTPGTLGPDNSGGGGQASTGGGNGQRVLQAFEVRTMGHAYGLELYLKRALTSKLGGFLSYTLSRSTRSYGNRSYIAPSTARTCSTWRSLTIWAVTFARVRAPCSTLGCRRPLPGHRRRSLARILPARFATRKTLAAR